MYDVHYESIKNNKKMEIKFMTVIEFIRDAILEVPAYYEKHPIQLLIAYITMGLFSVYILYGACKRIRKIRGNFHRVVSFFTALIRCCTFVFVGTLLMIADELAEIPNTRVNNRFFTEVIVIVVVYCIFLVTLYLYNDKHGKHKKDVDDDDGERDEKFAEHVLKSIVIVIASLLAIFTNIDLANFGFMLFGKTIGAWGLNILFSWSASILLGFVADVIFFPVFILFGNPMNDINAI